MIDESVFLKPGDVLGGLTLQGFSRAGVGTSLWLPQLGVCFDVGPGVQEQAVCSDFFITHAHLDHSAGIPYILSQRTLQGLFDHRIYAMGPLIDCYRTILDAWKNVEDFDYQAQLRALEVGSGVVVKLAAGYDVIPFKTVHRIPSQGYTLRHRKKKLKPEYAQLSEGEIKKLRGSGVDVTVELTAQVLSFTGDTQIEVFDVAPEICSSKMIFVEVSYYDEKKSVEEARRWGHIHIHEFKNRWDSLKCEYLVLKHTSRRHSRSDVLKSLNANVPLEWQNKVKVWGM